jgi:hypothetical protein
LHQLGDLATLLVWNATDPADDFEMHRNNYIYTWQINRNPFIDLPQLANYIWGANAGQVWQGNLSVENPSEASLFIYPNPAKESIVVSGLNSDYVLEIYTNVGSKIYESKLNGTHQIPTNWSSGISFVKITTDSKSYLKKIVIE